MQTMNRREFLRQTALIGSSILLPGCLSGQKQNTATKQTKPNIVLIVSDDQGWADIGYHSSEIKTPILDKLAKTGVELDCHYVQPQCTPTRVALITGRYPSRFGPHCTSASNEQSYPFGTLTMASMLKSQGYETAITGKWHMGSKPEWGPNHYGFDFSYGSLAGAVGMYDHRYRLNTPFAKTWHKNLKFIEEEGHATDLVTNQAVKWINEEHKKPFFLYVPFHSVHTPLVEEDKWLKTNRHIKNPDRKLMAAALTHLDHCVGRIINSLEHNGKRDDTIVIFFSDNGGFIGRYEGNNYPPPDPPLKDFSSNSPLRGGKSDVYEGGMRVPAIVNWPGKLKPQKVTAPMHAVDWMPTLAALSGFTPKTDPLWDGQNIWPALTGQKHNLTKRQLYWVWGNERDRIALRKADWKILKNELNAKWQLYNLTEDPYEKNNLAEIMPDKLNELIKHFQEEKSKDSM